MKNLSVVTNLKSQTPNNNWIKKTSQNISFKNISNDEFSPSNKNQNKSIIASLIAGIAAIFTAFKCKNIMKFFSKFFKTTQKEIKPIIEKAKEEIIENTPHIKPENITPSSTTKIHNKIDITKFKMDVKVIKQWGQSKLTTVQMHKIMALNTLLNKDEKYALIQLAKENTSAGNPDLFKKLLSLEIEQIIDIAKKSQESLKKSFEQLDRLYMKKAGIDSSTKMSYTNEFKDFEKLQQGFLIKFLQEDGVKLSAEDRLKTFNELCKKYENYDNAKPAERAGALSRALTKHYAMIHKYDKKRASLIQSTFNRHYELSQSKL